MVEYKVILFNTTFVVQCSVYVIRVMETWIICKGIRTTFCRVAGVTYRIYLRNYDSYHNSTVIDEV